LTIKNRLITAIHMVLSLRLEIPAIAIGFFAHPEIAKVKLSVMWPNRNGNGATPQGLLYAFNSILRDGESQWK